MSTAVVNSALIQLRAASGAQLNVDELPPRMRRAITLAYTVGAPLIPTIDAVIAAEDDRTALEQALGVATAQARSVATGLSVAPIVLVPLLGRITGADMLGFYRTPLGMWVLIAGGGMLVAGVLLLRLLVRRAHHAVASSRHTMPVVGALVVGLLFGPLVGLGIGVVAALILSRRTSERSQTPDLEEAVELVAIALDGGCSPAAAARQAAEHYPAAAVRLRRLALELDDVAGPAPWSPARQDDVFAALLATARRVGAPAVPAIRAHARRLRASDRATRLEQVEKLPAQLTFPTALLLLPATVLLVGAPIVAQGVAPLLL